MCVKQSQVLDRDEVVLDKNNAIPGEKKIRLPEKIESFEEVELKKNKTQIKITTYYT